VCTNLSCLHRPWCNGRRVDWDFFWHSAQHCIRCRLLVSRLVFYILYLFSHFGAHGTPKHICTSFSGPSVGSQASKAPLSQSSSRWWRRRRSLN
jgi:hypothetical protein